MRALLVVNPKATTTTERTRDVLVRALRSEVDLTVATTRRRGHGGELARQGAADGVDLVVTLGGDGTVNEVVNGLLADADPAGGGSDRRPALAVVPGGSTNVFARAIGLPREPTEGTGAILEALRLGRSRTVGLGRADDRYFVFCAGLGLDAAVIREVERARLRGRTATAGRYLRAAARQYLVELGEEPALALERPGEEPDTGLATALVQNGAPWTYLGDRPIDPNPDASFDKGLDVLGFRGLRSPGSAWAALRMLAGPPRGRHVLRRHDLSEFAVTSHRPEPFHLDGDYLGERQKVRFLSVPDAVRVIC
ncbi:diacylglycerol kinase [Pilimelia anulata]|uniref:Diacylglycerol kinase n=1 Tax=Pilimelia anulata TaxID=53371 RepID=A0A8J3FEP5_9ACTN|nr:diacylglycerol kinase family protein [Pilimelia anulata]GGK01347.1 diacylglycerol kinase [Pilimelia anulata]